MVLQVLKAMCQMSPQIFKDHLRDFYPYITRLVCCEQVNTDVMEFHKLYLHKSIRKRKKKDNYTNHLSFEGIDEILRQIFA